MSPKLKDDIACRQEWAGRNGLRLDLATLGDKTRRRSNRKESGQRDIKVGASRATSLAVYHPCDSSGGTGSLASIRLAPTAFGSCFAPFAGTALNASETVSASNVRRDGECLPPVTRVVSYVHSACNKPNSNEPAGIPDQNGKRSVSRSSAFKTEPRDRVRALLDCGESFALAQRRMLCTLREITRKEANC